MFLMRARHAGNMETLSHLSHPALLGGRKSPVGGSLSAAECPPRELLSVATTPEETSMETPNDIGRRLTLTDLEAALLAVVDSDPRFVLLGWHDIATAYRNALESILAARGGAA